MAWATASKSNGRRPMTAEADRSWQRPDAQRSKSARAAACAASPRPQARGSRWLGQHPPFRHGFSSLTRRIVVLNLIGLAILVSGILYLNQFRAGLIDAKVQSLLTQGEIIAARHRRLGRRRHQRRSSSIRRSCSKQEQGQAARR